ncbi:MAG: diguanylate cyclase domain-containing protein [Arenimonas sp.]
MSLRTLVVLGVGVAIVTWLSITLTRAQDGVAAIWIANGLLVGALLLRPRVDWPRLVLAAAIGTIVGRLLCGDAWPIMIGLTAANVIECLLLAGGIRARVPDIRDPSRLPTLARTAIIWALLACVVSASIAAVILWLVEGASIFDVWPVWFVAHLLGVVVVATLCVSGMRLRWRLLGQVGRRVDFAVCVLLLVGTCVVIGYLPSLPVLFLAYLPLMLLTLRHGFAGVVVGIGALSLASALLAAYGLGPFAQVAGSSVAMRALLLQLFIGAGCLLTYPTAVSQAERERLTRKLRHSENLYRLLAEHSRDLIVRLRADGQRPYVSAAAATVLGWTPAELAGPREDLVHPDDRARVATETARLFEEGGTLVTTYRMRHRDGHWVWLEASGQRVDTVDPPEVVYASRDVSARVGAEQALQESQAHLQAVADNMPAMIAHFDADERFTFANAAVASVLHIDPAQILGHTLREVRGDDLYAARAPHVKAVLAGESRTFEVRVPIHGQDFDHRIQLVPDLDKQGRVRGFYSLTQDITALKDAERELERLARFDALTGLANRRHFEESLTEAVARAQRNGTSLAVLVLDIDRFKQINDTYGHGAGDEVLKHFAARLRDCVYEVDLPARLGGDEFVVLVEYSPSIETGSTVARRITECMLEPIALRDSSLAVTASIGVGVHFPVRSAERVLELADQALYEAKDAGRATWRVRSG